MLGFGVLSTALVVFVAERMRRLKEHEERSLTPVFLLRFALYLPWLIREVFVANVAVARVVLSPGLPIRPAVLHFRGVQKTDLVRVVYANSITLTPGTVTMDVRGQDLTIHALVGFELEGHEETDMVRKMAWLEGE
jgi:multicomponent Na+:H+ antiporter subunit E